ncbi:hypothetical protein [Nonomuraea rubra]|uniref:hypothetical protein n=1 Tax=Nonomuraea rubra TaxID=46180 RepID=UPI0033EDFA64
MQPPHASSRGQQQARCRRESLFGEGGALPGQCSFARRPWARSAKGGGQSGQVQFVRLSQPAETTSFSAARMVVRSAISAWARARRSGAGWPRRPVPSSSVIRPRRS